MNCALSSGWVAACAVGAAACLGGPLDPPAGPIASTAKPLGDVEPRVAINATNTPGDADSVYKLNQNGSFYLTDDMVVTESGKVAIEITGQNVTLDLNGFTIRGFTTGTADGIAATSANVRNVTIRNGCVMGFPGDGIDLSMATSGGVHISGVHAHQNGENGIVLGERVIVEACTATMNTLDGFRVAGSGVIRSCVAHQNARAGFVVGFSSSAGDAAFIEACTASSNGTSGMLCYEGVSVTRSAATNNTSDGFAVQGQCVATECVARENGRDGFTSNIFGNGHVGQNIVACVASGNGRYGIYLDEGYGTIEGCQLNSNLADGIRAGWRMRIVGNNLVENSINAQNGAGIFITGQRCVVEGNTLTRNHRGIDVDGANNIIVGNRLAENTTNFTIVANNKVGVIVTAPNSGAISGSSGGAGMGTTDPNANIVY